MVLADDIVLIDEATRVLTISSYLFTLVMDKLTNHIEDGIPLAIFKQYCAY